MEAGADDIDSEEDDEVFVIKCQPSEYSGVAKELEGKNLDIRTSAMDLIPQNKIIIDDVNKANQVIKFIDALEDDDDVQKVYSNFDISEEVMTQLSQ